MSAIPIAQINLCWWANKSLFLFSFETGIETGKARRIQDELNVFRVIVKTLATLSVNKKQYKGHVLLG